MYAHYGTSDAECPEHDVDPTNLCLGCLTCYRAHEPPPFASLIGHADATLFAVRSALMMIVACLCCLQVCIYLPVARYKSTYSIL